MDDPPMSRMRIDYESRYDLLEYFPMDIIHSILARVPIEDAVKTSILSTQWKDVWASLPQLVFSDEYARLEYDTGAIQTRLQKFLTHAITHHKGPILKFKLFILSLNNCPNFDQWLLFLSKKDIKEFSIYIEDAFGSNDDWFLIDSNLYSCQNLTRLELYGCDLEPPPSTFKGFLLLRSLVLVVEADLDLIKTIVENAPLLENFSLNDTVNTELDISIPSLKFLNVSGDYDELRVCAPNLTKLVVTSGEDGFLDMFIPQISSIGNYADLLRGFPNLEHITGDLFFMKYLSIGINLCGNSLVFHQLKIIQLYDVCYQDTKVMLVVVRLLKGAPNLQMLEITTDGLEGEASEIYNLRDVVSFWDSRFEHSFTIAKLREIKMRDPLGLAQEKELIKFLLKRSPALETMTVDNLSAQISAEEMEKLMAEFLSYERASPNVVISLI